MHYRREEMVPRLGAVLRVVFAWFMIWPFFDKLLGLGYATPSGYGLLDGTSPSGFVVYVTDGVLADFWNSVGGTAAADTLMMVGLLAIGIGLLTGCAVKITCIAFTVFLFLMYTLVLPPTDNPIIDYHITWILALWLIYFAGGFEQWSLSGWWRRIPLVRRYPILE